MLNNDPLHNVKNTDWYELYIESTDLYLCNQRTIEEAHFEAPTDVVKAYVFGIFESRQRNANLSGGSF